MTFLALFQQRGDLVKADTSQPGVVVIDLPPDPNKRSSLPIFGFTLHVNLDNRVAVTKIQRYRIVGEKRILCRETNILRSRRISNATNFEVPVLAETVFYDTDDVGTFGAPIRRIRLEVDESQSKWNCEIPESTFSTKIPSDFVIQDQI